MNTSIGTNSSESTAFMDHFLRNFAFGLISSGLFVGVPLYSFTFWQLLKNTRESLNSDIFFANIIVADLLFSLSSIFYLVHHYHSFRPWFHAYTFSVGLLYTARPVFHCCVCVDCYVGVVHPVLFLRFQPLRFRVACSFVGWLISLASCFYSCITFFSVQNLMTYFVENIVFFCIMLFCCLSVLRTLCSQGPGENLAERRKRDKVKQKAFKIILLITISMSINFSLYICVIPLLFVMTNDEFVLAIVLTVAASILTGYVHPLIYLHKCGKLTFFKMF